MKMEPAVTFDIKAQSRVPKYRQVVSEIVRKIHSGELTQGQQIPSINETSFECFLSRDTVEKAYRELRKMGVIRSVPGKGYYVQTTTSLTKQKVLLLVSEMHPQIEQIGKKLSKSLESSISVNVHYMQDFNLDTSEDFLLTNQEVYDVFLPIPHYFHFSPQTIAILKKLPKNKMRLSGKTWEDIQGNKPFWERNYSGFGNILEELLPTLQKFRKISFLPQSNGLCGGVSGIREEVELFCNKNRISLEANPINAGNLSIEKGQVFFTCNDDTLVSIIREAQANGLEIGRDVGIVSLRKSALNELLLGGITSICPSPGKIVRQLETTLARNPVTDTINSFELNLRSSL